MGRQVPERVHGVFRGAGVGRNVADHDGVAEADKRILEDHRQFAASERSVAFALIQGADALLQREQGLVDLCPVDLGLLVLVDMVSASLIAGEVDEGNLGEELLLVLEGDLQDGV